MSVCTWRYQGLGWSLMILGTACSIEAGSSSAYLVVSIFGFCAFVFVFDLSNCVNGYTCYLFKCYPSFIFTPFTITLPSSKLTFIFSLCSINFRFSFFLFTSIVIIDYIYWFYPINLSFTYLISLLLIE